MRADRLELPARSLGGAGILEEFPAPAPGQRVQPRPRRRVCDALSVQRPLHGWVQAEPGAARDAAMNRLWPRLKVSAAEIAAEASWNLPCRSSASTRRARNKGPAEMVLYVPITLSAPALARCVQASGRWPSSQASHPSAADHSAPISPHELASLAALGPSSSFRASSKSPRCKYRQASFASTQAAMVGIPSLSSWRIWPKRAWLASRRPSISWSVPSRSANIQDQAPA